MIKFLKGDSWYFPADSVLALDTKTDADNVVIYVKDENGTATNGTLTASGTNTAAEGYLYAEALIEEINFGKQVVIDLTAVYQEADGTAFTVAKV
jgi:hypothetical protein